MNIRDMEYLVAVAKFGHFGKASDACHVSQPTLSMQLKKLEDTLGVQLFERTNKYVMVTQVGARIVERARTILHEVEGIKEIAQLSLEPFHMDIKLGAFPTLAPYLFPLMVPEVIEAYPHLKLYLREEKTEMLIEKLLHGDLDAALLAYPVQSDALASVELFEDPFYLAVSSRHPLAGRKSVEQSELLQYNLLLLEEGHCLRDQALDVCTIMQIGEEVDFRATSLETLRQMVAANVGITLMPKIAIPADRGQGIVYIPFDGHPPSRKIGMFWRKSSAKGEVFAALAALVQENASARQ